MRGRSEPGVLRSRWAALAAIASLAGIILALTSQGPTSPQSRHSSTDGTPPHTPKSDSVVAAAKDKKVGSAASQKSPPESSTDHEDSADPSSQESASDNRNNSHFKRDLGKLFAMAPISIKPWQLSRHVDLNIIDAPLTSEQDKALTELLDTQREILRTQENRLGEQRAGAMMDLMKRGRLKPFTLESLEQEQRDEVLLLAEQRRATASAELNKRRQEDPSLTAIRERSHLNVTGALIQLGRKFAPDASAFVLHKGIMHMATDKQMEVLAEEVMTTKNARRSFLYAILAWFVEEQLTTPEKASLIAESFEAWIQKS